MSDTTAVFGTALRIVRTFPAMIDYAARVVEWFETHLNCGGTSR